MAYTPPPIVAELLSQPGVEYKTAEEFKKVWAPPKKIKVFRGTDLYKIIFEEADKEKEKD